MLEKGQIKEMTPHGPLGETLVPFESGQYKPTLFSLSKILKPKSLRTRLGSC